MSKSAAAICCVCGDFVNNSGLTEEEAFQIKEEELMDEWVCIACIAKKVEGKGGYTPSPNRYQREPELEEPVSYIVVIKGQEPIEGAVPSEEKVQIRANSPAHAAAIATAKLCENGIKFIELIDVEEE